MDSLGGDQLMHVHKVSSRKLLITKLGLSYQLPLLQRRNERWKHQQATRVLPNDFEAHSMNSLCNLHLKRHLLHQVQSILHGLPFWIMMKVNYFLMVPLIFRLRDLSYHQEISRLGCKYTKCYEYHMRFNCLWTTCKKITS